jgi:phosphoribosylformimino-5-aminoimidazole carboxamide ribotide isomerase
MLLIPSIDIRGGQCVRLLRGDFAAETVYDATPEATLERYAALGARWLHVVDLDGARDGQLGNRDLIATLAAHRDVRIQVGGGVRRRETIDALLALGVARVVVGSAAVDAVADTHAWLQALGGERVCLAFDVGLDAQGTPRLRTHGWRTRTTRSLWDAVAEYESAGLRHVLCTDVALDGALEGPNLALYREAVRRHPHIAWQASGGVSGAADLSALAGCGVAAAISGKALLENRISTEALQPYLRVG